METIVRRYFTEVLDGGNSGVVTELFTADCKIHRPELEIEGIANFTRFIAGVPKAFSSFETTLHDLFGSEDRVAVRLTHHCTVRENLRSRLGVFPVANRPVSWDAIAIFRFQGDRICEEWVSRDELGMLIHAGVVSTSQ